MKLLFQQDSEPSERPAGLTGIAAILLFYAAVAFIYAALIANGSISIMRGAWIVGGGLEILGGGIFVLYGGVHALCAVGLWRMRKWALFLSSLVLVYGLIQITPAISSAVADSRVLAIAREGVQIIWRVAALWYLWQEPTRDAFDARSQRE